jgi:hypothetical protein
LILINTEWVNIKYQRLLRKKNKGCKNLWAPAKIDPGKVQKSASFFRGRTGQIESLFIGSIGYLMQI